MVYIWPDTLLFLDTITESMFTIYNLFDLGSYDFMLPDIHLGFYPTEYLSLEITEFECCNMDTTSVNCSLFTGPEGDQDIIRGDDDDNDDLWGEPEDPVPGRRCPSCLERGDTVWVIPGKCCTQCGTPVN